MAKITEAKLATAIALRDLAIALLDKVNAEEDDEGRVWFERAHRDKSGAAIGDVFVKKCFRRQHLAGRVGYG